MTGLLEFPIEFFRTSVLSQWMSIWLLLPLQTSLYQGKNDSTLCWKEHIVLKALSGLLGSFLPVMELGGQPAPDREF